MNNNAIFLKPQKTRKKHSCFWIFIVVLIIFLAFCGGTLYLKYKNFKESFTNNNVDKTITTSQLKNKVSSLGSGQATKIKIYDSDLNEIIQKSPSFPLENPTVKIETDQILLSGKTGSGFLSIPVEIGIVPEVKQGKLAFNIAEIKTAGVPAPKQLSDSLSSSLTQYLNNSLELANNVNVTSIELQTGVATITGEKK